jgi:hypothetical protein
MLWKSLLSSCDVVSGAAGLLAEKGAGEGTHPRTRAPESSVYAPLSPSPVTPPGAGWWNSNCLLLPVGCTK